MAAIDSSMWLSAGNDADVFVYAPLMDGRLEATDQANFVPKDSLDFGDDSMVLDEMLSISTAQPASAPRTRTADSNAMVLYDSTQAVDAPRTADSNAMVLYESTQAADAGKTADSVAVVPCASTNTGKAACPKCGVLVVKRVLHRHMRQKHNGTGSSLYECQDCGKPFQRRDNWKRHLLEQHGEESGEDGMVECMACGKFVRTRYFKDHSARKGCLATKAKTSAAQAALDANGMEVSSRFMPETVLDPLEITIELYRNFVKWSRPEFHVSTCKNRWPHWLWDMRGLVLRTMSVSKGKESVAGSATIMEYLDTTIGVGASWIHGSAVIHILYGDDTTYDPAIYNRRIPVHCCERLAKLPPISSSDLALGNVGLRLGWIVCLYQLEQEGCQCAVFSKEPLESLMSEDWTKFLASPW